MANVKVPLIRDVVFHDKNYQPDIEKEEIQTIFMIVHRENNNNFGTTTGENFHLPCRRVLPTTLKCKSIPQEIKKYTQLQSNAYTNQLDEIGEWLKIMFQTLFIIDIDTIINPLEDDGCSIAKALFTKINFVKLLAYEYPLYFKYLKNEFDYKDIECNLMLILKKRPKPIGLAAPNEPILNEVCREFAAYLKTVLGDVMTTEDNINNMTDKLYDEILKTKNVDKTLHYDRSNAPILNFTHDLEKYRTNFQVSDQLLSDISENQLSKSLNASQEYMDMISLGRKAHDYTDKLITQAALIRSIEQLIKSLPKEKNTRCKCQNESTGTSLYNDLKELIKFYVTCELKDFLENGIASFLCGGKWILYCLRFSAVKKDLLLIELETKRMREKDGFWGYHKIDNRNDILVNANTIKGTQFGKCIVNCYEFLNHREYVNKFFSED